MCVELQNWTAISTTQHIVSWLCPLLECHQLTKSIVTSIYYIWTCHALKIWLVTTLKSTSGENHCPKLFVILRTTSSLPFNMENHWWKAMAWSCLTRPMTLPGGASALISHSGPWQKPVELDENWATWWTEITVPVHKWQQQQKKQLVSYFILFRLFQ